mmetsp:Transcript_115123/g.325305  ORF Transcript_115123/g.325305 Transcript_115123/m.325305 type:complete len:104 (+) Transcript_115123:535-846(+)
MVKIGEADTDVSQVRPRQRGRNARRSGTRSAPTAVPNDSAGRPVSSSCTLKINEDVIQESGRQMSSNLVSGIEPPELGNELLRQPGLECDKALIDSADAPCCR